MRRASVLCCLIPFFFLFAFIKDAKATTQAKGDNGVYIAYMGAAAAPNDQLLSSLLRRKRNEVVRSYRHGFSGFAAHLSKEEALSIAQRPGVVSVFPDPLVQLHTTRSWDFLKYQTELKIDVTPPGSESAGSISSGSSDIIIGILDTGIWPESESFSDKDMLEKYVCGG